MIRHNTQPHQIGQDAGHTAGPRVRTVLVLAYVIPLGIFDVAQGRGTTLVISVAMALVVAGCYAFVQGRWSRPPGRPVVLRGEPVVTPTQAPAGFASARFESADRPLRDVQKREVVPRAAETADRWVRL